MVHFEDVISDRITEVERILGFLNIEKDEDRLACLQHCNVDMYQRNSKKLERSPFTDKLRSVVDGSISKVDSILVQYGHQGIPYGKYSLL